MLRKNLVICGLVTALGISLVRNITQHQKIKDLESEVANASHFINNSSGNGISNPESDYVWQFRIPNRQRGQVDNLMFAVPNNYYRANHNKVEDNTGDNSKGQLYLRGLDYTDPVLVSLAKYLTSPKFLTDQSLEAKAQRIVDIAFCLPRVEDGETLIIRSPLNTLIYGGDCEDKARLALVLLTSLGIDCELAVLKFDSPRKGHVTLGIRGNFKAPGGGEQFFYDPKEPDKKSYFAEVGGFLGDTGRVIPKLNPGVIGVMDQKFQDHRHIYTYKLR